MQLQVTQAGDEVLRQQAEKLTEKDLLSDDTQRLIDLLVGTMRGSGVGLAAPQVGVSKRIVVLEDTEDYIESVDDSIIEATGRKPFELQILINPELTVLESESFYFFEGCMSVEGYRAIAPRGTKVRVAALDRGGSPFEFTATDWHARILQHEIDHLDGVLYVDNMLPRTMISEKHYTKKFRAAKFEEFERFLADCEVKHTT